MSKFYAVKVGRNEGIYNTWEECKKQVDKYPGAVYKSFDTCEEAKTFIFGEAKDTKTQSQSLKNASEEVLPNVYAFVDGSYNQATKVYGYGGFLMVDGKKYILSGNGSDEEMATMRNVAGEICGSRAAISKALELGIKELYIYYDYMGIEYWATGAWKRNKEGTIAYYEYVNSVKDKINIIFKKVKAHTNIPGNEEADKLAKEAVGLM